MKLRKIMAVLLALTLLACPSLPVYSVESDNLPEAPELPEVVENEKDELTQDASDFGKVLDYVDKADFEARDYEFRVPFAEELNTYVFQDSEGNRTVYMFDENVKYTDSDGRIVEKDLSLIKTDTGYTTTANDVELVLPDNLKNGVFITYNGHTVKMVPKETGDTVKAEIKENNVIYRDSFGTGISIKYTPLLSGVKEDIVLSRRPDNASFGFIIDIDDLVISDKDGSIILTDSETGGTFSFGQLFIFDAEGKYGNGNIIVSATGNENEYTVSIDIDEEFLSSPATVYPVTVDPTITVSDNTHGTNAIWDSVIYEGRPNSNFGSNYYNIIGIPSGAPSNGVGRMVVKLPTFTSLTEYSTITASQITSVEFHAKESAGGTSQFINLYPLVSNTTWTETNVTWNNVGTHTTEVNFGTTAYGAQWTTFDITNLVKGWKNGTYSAGAGFILSSNNANIEKGFCSSEYSSSYRPYVVMTYIPTDCGGDSFDNAEVITLNVCYAVNIDAQYELKYMKFVPGTTGIYSFISSANIGDPYARLYNNFKQQIDADDDSAGSRNFCLSYHLMAGTTYYFEASCYGSGTGTYAFCICNANASSIIDCSTMTLGTNTSINITVPYKIACYKVIPTETKEYLFFSSNKTGDPEIWIYNSSFGCVNANDDGAENYNFRLPITLTAGAIYYIVLRHYYSNVGSFGFNTFYEANIPYGSYYLKNAGSMGYMDIEGPGVQEWVHQWSKHNGLQEKWRIEQDSDGYYTLRSEYSAKKFVGISSTSASEDNIKLYSSISNSTRWKIYKNASNALILIPMGASEKVLCVPDDDVGTRLRLRAINDLSTPNRGSWVLDSYSLSINTFYDHAFNVRYGDGDSLVSSFADEICRILWGTVGLEVTMNSPTMLLSTPDQCKTQRGLSITSITINANSSAICPSNPSVEENCPYYLLNKIGHSDCENCTSWYQAYRDFIRDYPGNETTASILFIGSRLFDDDGDECNRSFRWYNNGIILQEIWGSSSLYAETELPCVLHEISHEIGAPDHYHEMITNDLGQRVCRGGAMCSVCNPATGRPQWCSMGDYGGWRTDLDICDMDEVYCEGCRNQIIEHLIDHHFD